MVVLAKNQNTQFLERFRCKTRSTTDQGKVLGRRTLIELWVGPENLSVPCAAECGLYSLTIKFNRVALTRPAANGDMGMKVSDILRVKGNTLFTVSPDEDLALAVQVMSDRDIGSLVVMEHGDVVGMLTFREVIQAFVKNGGVGTTLVRSAMDDAPMTCTMETDMDEVRRMMLDRHARYMPVMDKRMLMGVISLYDVAKAVVDSQNFENRMLKAYIRDWPEGERQGAD